MELYLDYNMVRYIRVNELQLAICGFEPTPKFRLISKRRRGAERTCEPFIIHFKAVPLFRFHFFFGGVNRKDFFSR